MITISRRQARTLRAVFRCHRLGISHKGPVPPLFFSLPSLAMASASGTARPTSPLSARPAV